MANDPKEIKKLLKEIEDIYKRLGEKNPWQGVAEASVDMNKLKEDLKDAQEYLDIITDKSSELVSSFRAINNEVAASNKLYNVGSKSLGSLTSISEKLRDSQQKISTLSSSQVKKLQEKLRSEQANLLEIRKQLRAKERVNDISAKEQLLLDNISGLLSEQDSSLKSLNESLQEEYQTIKKIEKSMGITGGILKGMAKIPILGDLIGVQDALEAAKEAAEDGAGRWGTLGAAMKSVGTSLTSSLTDPLFIIGAIVKAFKMLLELGFKVDAQQTALAKSFSLSHSAAKGLRDSFSAIQESTSKTMGYQERSLIHTTSLTEAATQLGEAFDAGVLPTRSQLENQIMLTKQIGLSTDEANNLQQLAYQNNMTADDITKEVINQTAAYRRQSGVQLNNKKILQDISKVSGQLRLQYANNPGLIAKAVIQTQKLGMSLEQAKKAAEGLLNFEESIENELSAELLTGKALNLERARLLALNGDSAAAVEEMAKQIGTAADFSKMNVIQQEALAKAIGMSADDLANSLIYREQLNKLGNDGKSQIEATVKALQEQGRIEEANNLQRDIANGVDAEKALKRVDQQTKFNGSIEKLKLILADVVDGPAQKLVSLITSLVQNAGLIKGIFIAIASVIGGIKLGGLISQVVTLAMTAAGAAASSIAMASAITLGLGAIAIGAGIALLMSNLFSATDQAKSKIKANDMISPAPGGSGYGKRTLFGPEGAIALNNKDTIVAGTNLGITKGNDVAMAPAGGFKATTTNSNAEIVAAINSLKQSMAAVASRPVNVSVDGKTFIEATIGNQPNTFGDTVGRNSYKPS